MYLGFFYVLKVAPVRSGTPASYAVCQASSFLCSLNTSVLRCVPDRSAQLPLQHLVPRKPDLYTTGSVLRIVKYTSSVTSYCKDDVAV